MCPHSLDQNKISLRQLNFCLLRQGLTTLIDIGLSILMWPRLVSNLRHSVCLSFPNAGITGVSHYSWLNI